MADLGSTESIHKVAGRSGSGALPQITNKQSLSTALKVARFDGDIQGLSPG